MGQSFQPAFVSFSFVVQVMDDVGVTGAGLLLPEYHLPQKCTRKGIGRQGIVLIHRNSLQKEPTPCRHVPLLM